MLGEDNYRFRFYANAKQRCQFQDVEQRLSDAIRAYDEL